MLPDEPMDLCVEISEGSFPGNEISLGLVPIAFPKDSLKDFESTYSAFVKLIPLNHQNMNASVRRVDTRNT